MIKIWCHLQREDDDLGADKLSRKRVKKEKAGMRSLWNLGEGAGRKDREVFGRARMQRQLWRAEDWDGLSLSPLTTLLP